jgi:hypothetical protein
MGYGGGIIKQNSIVALLCTLAIVLCILPSAESLNNQNTIQSPSNIVSTDKTSVLHVKTVKAMTVKKIIKGYGIKVTSKIVTATARCSCGALGNYNFHKGTFLNYCPVCHKYGVLKWNPKSTPEGEWTCKCGADYCAACGKIKIKHKKTHLTKA